MFDCTDQTQEREGRIDFVTLEFLEVDDAITYANGHLNLWPQDAVDSPHGPFTFDELEWLEVPYHFDHKPERTIPARRTVQNVEPLASALDALGQLPLELTTTGLRVVGYLTPAPEDA